MNSKSKSSAILKWRNRAAQLEFHRADSNHHTDSDLSGFFDAALKLRGNTGTSHTSENRPALIHPVDEPSAAPRLPDALLRRSYQRIAENPEGSPPVLISLIRSQTYGKLIRMPAPKGLATRVPASLLPTTQPERWKWVMEALPGPKYLEASPAPIINALSTMPIHLRPLIEALCITASGNLVTGWSPEELEWLEAAAGIKPDITGVYLYTEIQDAVPPYNLITPDQMSASPLNVAYGWWLESVIASYDGNDTTCQHWATHYERLATLRVALAVASKGYNVLAYGMGAVAITRPESQEDMARLHQIALGQQSQVLSSEGRPEIPESLTPATLPEQARTPLIYSRLLANPNPTQLTRMLTTGRAA